MCMCVCVLYIYVYTVYVCVYIYVARVFMYGCTCLRAYETFSEKLLFEEKKKNILHFFFHLENNQLPNY